MSERALSGSSLVQVFLRQIIVYHSLSWARNARFRHGCSLTVNFKTIFFFFCLFLTSNPAVHATKSSVRRGEVMQTARDQQTRHHSQSRSLFVLVISRISSSIASSINVNNTLEMWKNAPPPPFTVLCRFFTLLFQFHFFFFVFLIGMR